MIRRSSASYLSEPKDDLDADDGIVEVFRHIVSQRTHPSLPPTLKDQLCWDLIVPDDDDHDDVTLALRSAACCSQLCWFCLCALADGGGNSSAGSIRFET